MATLQKRVVRSDLWIDRAFDERLARETDISLQVFAVNGNPAAAWDMLAGAHVYHISAAKDELPQEWFARADLHCALPEPDVRVGWRCGLRHGRCCCLHGSRRGRREPGRRQRSVRG